MALVATAAARIHVGELDLEVVDIDAEFIYLDAVQHPVDSGFAVLRIEEDDGHVERVVYLRDGIRELQARYEVMEYVE